MRERVEIMNVDWTQDSGLKQLLQNLDSLPKPSERAVSENTMVNGRVKKVQEASSDDEGLLLCEMRQQCSAIRQKMEELRLSLSRSLPHELRTPLNAILGFSSYLLSLESAQSEQNDEMTQIYAAIYTNACRLQHLIENYLIYARLELIKENPEKLHSEMWQHDEWLQPCATIGSTISFHAERAERESDIQLELAQGAIRFSKKSLQKIVEELLDNAMKFSKPGTTIRIISGVEDGEWRLQVNDQGRGMSAEQIADIGAYVQFDREFYAQQGAGLGLAIVQLLTNIHAGTLTIDSVPNQGTTVTVSFPQAEE